jgi:hypothetical protein
MGVMGCVTRKEGEEAKEAKEGIGLSGLGIYIPQAGKAT